MFARKNFGLFTICFMLLSQNLFPQIILQGVVIDNGAEYFGNGAEPVANVLVTLTDQADANRTFSAYTDGQGQYSIQITQTGVDDNPSGTPGNFRLLQNYPNPFNPSTIIGFELLQPCRISIEIFNVLGQKVKTLLDGFKSSSGQVIWNATDDHNQGVPAGLYICSMQAGDVRINKKMLLIDGQQGQIKVSPSQTTGSVTEIRTQTVLNKSRSDQYMLQVTSDSIETHKQQNLAITGNMTLDITVNRTVTGNDGNVYRTVKIGDQWWMAENLRVTHYRNNDPIINVTDTTQWANLTTGAYCDYDNNENHVSTYGRLYNGYAIEDSCNIAPEGWHIPNDGEWKVLELHLGMSQLEVNNTEWRGTDEGGKLKQSGTTHWDSPNIGATNASNFTALPGGFREGETGYYGFLSDSTFFWTLSDNDSMSHWCRCLNDSSAQVGRFSNHKKNGYSVRCVRDAYSPESLYVITITPSIDTLENSQSQQFKCIATYSDSSTRDVTSLAAWSLSPGIAGSVNSTGLFTADDSSTGLEILNVCYQSKSALMEINVIAVAVNKPPTAAFIVSPLTGVTGTIFYFDANGCNDYEDDISNLQVRWDWSNNGNWNTNYSTTKTESHKYATTGTKTIKLEVKDTGGLTNTTTRQIKVNSGIETGTMTGNDGKTYQTVKIGNKWWMAENLKETKYRDGSAIPNVTGASTWNGLTTGARCAYNNNESTANTYGYLYNWYAAVDSRHIAPAGWHVPTDTEWAALAIYLGGSSVAGGKLKETGTVHWTSPNTGATNKSGFSALPCGWRSNSGEFSSMGTNAPFWSSTEYDSNFSWNRYLTYNYSGISRSSIYKCYGFSIRLVRD